MNSKIEHELLKLCAENTKAYLAQSPPSEMDIVFVTPNIKRGVTV